jgi:hypothetical protein
MSERAPSCLFALRSPARRVYAFRKTDNHDGALSADRNTPIRLTVGERTLRPLYVEWMRHVAKSPRHPERVLLRLGSTPPPQESA